MFWIFLSKYTLGEHAGKLLKFCRSLYEGFYFEMLLYVPLNFLTNSF